MLTKEDLLLISGLMDSKITPLKDEMQEMRGEIAPLKDEMQEMRGEIAPLKDEMQEMKRELNEEIVIIKVTLENEILPELKNLSSCYAGGFDKYTNSVDRLDNLEKDMEVVKRAVKDHSKQLNAMK